MALGSKKLLVLCGKWRQWATPDIAVEPTVEISRDGKVFKVVFTFEHVAGGTVSQTGAIRPDWGLASAESLLQLYYLWGLTQRYTPKLLRAKGAVIECSCGKVLERLPAFDWEGQTAYECDCGSEELWEAAGKDYTPDSPNWEDILEMWQDAWETLPPHKYPLVETAPPMSEARQAWEASAQYVALVQTIVGGE